MVKDMMQVGIHVMENASPAALVRKTLRANLSDLAAMGADSRYYLLGLALESGIRNVHMDELIQGLQADHAEFGVSIIGGDTTRANGAMLASITAIGSLPEGQNPLRRSGARAGDDVWVTGTLGDAALGLSLLRGHIKPETGTENDLQYLRDRYWLPSPRLAAGIALRDLATSAIDISDGLAADCGHLAAASDLSMHLSLDGLPRSYAFRAVLGEGSDPADEWELLNGGDDYELLFTSAQDRRADIAQTAKSLNIPMTRIGAVDKGAGVMLYDASGTCMELPMAGFTHF